MFNTDKTWVNNQSARRVCEWSGHNVIHFIWGIKLSTLVLFWI